MIANDKKLLHALLRALVEGWGREVVLQELTRIADRKQGDSIEPQSEKDVARASRKVGRQKISSAVQLVDTLDLIDVRREQLRAIALKYDERRFLPSLVDVREFISMRGGQVKQIKDRLHGFRLFLNLAGEMPLGMLEELAATNNFSGPSQLAPLSKAIKAAGDARRENPQSEDRAKDVSRATDEPSKS